MNPARVIMVLLAEKSCLASYLSQLLVKPILILVLSPEYTFLVAPVFAHICFTTNIILNLKASVSIMFGDGTVSLQHFDPAT
jgi:predicted ABC-type exoprotein transport system permease subunit